MPQESSPAKVPSLRFKESLKLRKKQHQRQGQEQSDERQLSSQKDWEVRNGGQRFFSEPQTTDKHLKEGVSAQRLEAIRIQLTGMRITLQT